MAVALPNNAIISSNWTIPYYVTGTIHRIVYNTCIRINSCAYFVNIEREKKYEKMSHNIIDYNIGYGAQGYLCRNSLMCERAYNIDDTKI